MSKRGSRETAPLVTVIVPTYNRAHTLQRALDSIISQVDANLEILVVDDHSEDDTRDLVLEYRKSNPQTQYLTNPGRQGPSAARNVGLNHATGRFVAFLESDDEWDPGHVSRCVALLTSTPANIVFSDVVKLRDGKPAASSGTRLQQMAACAPEPVPGLPDCYLIGDHQALLGFFIDCRPLVYLTTVVYDHHALPATFNESYCIAEDLAFYIHLVLDHDAAFGFVDATGTIKHEDPDSMSRWMQLDPGRYYASQLDTYRFLKQTFHARLGAAHADRLAVQTATQADRLAGCLRAEGDRQSARARYLEAFQAMPSRHARARLKLLAKVVATSIG